jgi:hypothetical protein
MKFLDQVQKFSNDMSFREKVLTEIASKIEQNFGRAKSRIHTVRNFEMKKAEIIEEIKNEEHFSEKGWVGCDKILLENSKLISLSSSSEGGLQSEYILLREKQSEKKNHNPKI